MNRRKILYRELMPSDEVDDKRREQPRQASKH